jgi:hypothetical protein
MDVAFARGSMMRPSHAGVVCFLGFSGLAATVQALPSTHPFLFFDDISKCNGYQNRNADPWKSWEASVMGEADAALSQDLTAANDFSEACANLGLAYQITKNQAYAAKAAEAIIHWSAGACRRKLRFVMRLPCGWADGEAVVARHAAWVGARREARRSASRSKSSLNFGG